MIADDPTIKLVAFDLDGTLMQVSKSAVAAPVRQAIKSAQSRNVIVTLATGRPFSFSWPVAQTLNIQAPLICYQGGVIQRMDGRLLQEHTLSGQELAPAIHLGREQNWQFYLERDGKLILESGRRYDEMLFSIHPLPVEWVNDLTGSEQRASQYGLFHSDGIGETDVLDLQAALGPNALVMQTHRHFANVIPAQVSKGNALAWLANHLSIPRENVMTVGDSDNDVSMVSWAEVGVAMGNASPSVLKVADWVAPSLENHGAAAAIERYILTNRNFQ